MDREGFLTIKDLMNFHYCKRLIYFENVLRIPQTTTIKELKGRKLHELFEKKTKRNKIVKEFPKLPKEYNLHLESKYLNFRTFLDCLIIDRTKNTAFPLEYKDAKRPKKIYRTFKIQMLAESLLVKTQLGYNVQLAFIKFEQSGELAKISIEEKNLEQVKETIREINRIVESELIPEPTVSKKKCKDCCYWRICRRI